MGRTHGSWVDNWYEGGVIKELFPRMFALELNKNATVSSKLNASSLDNSFRRKARSGIEEMQLNSLAEISRMTTLVPCEDRYRWTFRRLCVDNLLGGISTIRRCKALFKWDDWLKNPYIVLV
ncbi:hypothetical protein Tco_0117113 [Tanacetum coccineum]